jgi:hypothetical protein
MRWVGIIITGMPSLAVPTTVGLSKSRGPIRRKERAWFRDNSHPAHSSRVSKNVYQIRSHVKGFILNASSMIRGLMDVVVATVTVNDG